MKQEFNPNPIEKGTTVKKKGNFLEVNGESRYVVYTAEFIKNRDKLLEMFPPKHPVIYAHHSTIDYLPKNVDNLEIGKQGKLKIIGRFYDEKGDALVVENPKSIKKHPHITISCIEGVPPAYCEKMLDDAFLNGKVEYLDKEEHIDVAEGFYDGETKEDVLSSKIIQEQNKTLEEVRKELLIIEKEEERTIYEYKIKIKDSFNSFIKDKKFQWKTFEKTSNSGKTILRVEKYYDMEKDLLEFRKTDPILKECPLDALFSAYKFKKWNMALLDLKEKNFYLKESGTETGESMIERDAEEYKRVIEEFTNIMVEKELSVWNKKRKEVLNRCQELQNEINMLCLIKEKLPTVSEHAYLHDLKLKEQLFIALSVIEKKDLMWEEPDVYSDLAPEPIGVDLMYCDGTIARVGDTAYVLIRGKDLSLETEYEDFKTNLYDFFDAKTQKPLFEKEAIKYYDLFKYEELFIE